jgi:hypothetical protein
MGGMRMTVRAVLAGCLLTTLVAACARDEAPKETAASTPTSSAGCDGVDLRATDIGITADTITVEVIADVGNPLAPGLFQGNLDALQGFAEYVNADGGIACRQLVVKTWDSHLDANEAKNGQIDACQHAFALVSSNALFNPDTTVMAECKDARGLATGLPDLPGTANDPAQLCNRTTFMAAPVVQTCPIVEGRPRTFRMSVGSARYFSKRAPGAHGIYLIPGDLPTTVQSATYIIRSQELGGLRFDATPKVSGRTEQSGYTPIIQTMRSVGADFVVNGSNDASMIKLRREAKAQGYDGVKRWACIPSCYSRAFREAGPDVDGTYVTLGHLPFEEADLNEDLGAFLEHVGVEKVDGFGALAWQAADLFRQAVDDVVEAEGPNGLTRASLLDALAHVRSFDANGWAARKTDLHGGSPCFVIIQIEGGEFHRVHPKKRGTMDCDPKNIVSFELDPAAEAAKLP